MPPDTDALMRDLYHFLKEHSAPPRPDSLASEAFWWRTAEELCELGAKYEAHPLREMFVVAYEYIEQLQKGMRR